MPVTSMRPTVSRGAAEPLAGISAAATPDVTLAVAELSETRHAADDRQQWLPDAQHDVEEKVNVRRDMIARRAGHASRESRRLPSVVRRAWR